MSSYQLEFENFQTQHWEDHNEKEERELEEALSFSDLPIITTTTGKDEEEGAKEENDNDNSEFNFDFGSLVGSVRSLEGEMCAADEVFSGGQLLPYRNSVSSMSGLRSISVSDPDRRGFGSRSSSSRSSSVRSHYSTTSSSGSGGGGGGGGSSCSSISAKTFPLVSKSSKVVQNQNQFHSYPSPKPQILGPGARYSTYAASPAVKKSKMWEVLKLGLVRTPEIELQGLKLRCNNHHTNNFGNKTTFMIPRNNSTGSNSSSSSNKGGNNNNDDRARKSFSGNGGKISEFFMLEMQRRKNNINQSSEIIQKTGKGGFFKNCKCTIGVIEPVPVVRSNNCNKFGKGQNVQPAASQVRDEDKQQKQKEKQEQEKHQQRRNNEIRQGEQVMYLNDVDYYGGFEQEDLDQLFEAMQDNYKAWCSGFAPLAVGGDMDSVAVQEFSRTLFNMRPDIALSVGQTIFQSDFRHLLCHVTVPCHIIQSIKDLAVPVVVSEYLHRNLGGDSIVEVMSSEGHLPQLSSPDSVIPVLLRHIRRDIVV
ncbi:hypothetical protein SOVF_100130 [Spinacia oleracea]|nr:hypothetical protein SOVF_100130 [Spinacia oleracea]